MVHSVNAFRTVVTILVVAIIAVTIWLKNAPGLETIQGSIRSHDVLLANYGEEKLETEIRTLCSQCHKFPNPQLLPAYRWTDEIDRGMRFHRESGEKSIHVPDERLILAWFQKHAKPMSIAEGKGETDRDTIFGQTMPGPMLKSYAATSGLMPVDSDNDRTMLFLDMISGYVRESNLNADSGYKVVHRAKNPSRLRTCDLSDEFEVEYLLSDLGTSGVTDDLCGSVYWMTKKTSDDEAFKVSLLCDQLGRVSDARSADFDGDGDEDVIIAEFGWEKTGSVVLLENVDGTFRRSTLDDRHGPVEIELADMDDDGLMDFVVIFGQEYESVELFRNTGGLGFEVRRLYRADMPTFGMSSLSLVDTDNDGDLDILFSSGDMYDSFQIQEHHGLYLMTNDGQGTFSPQLVGNQVGIMSSLAGDVDNDGDLDFVAGSFIPQESPYSRSEAYPAVVFYEQVEPGQWEQHVLKSGDCSHAAITMMDLDDDGDKDLVAGILHDAGGDAEPAWIAWTNLSKPKP